MKSVSSIIPEDLRSQREETMVVFIDLDRHHFKSTQASKKLDDLGLREDFGERCVLQRAVHDVGSKNSPVESYQTFHLEGVLHGRVLEDFQNRSE